MRKIILIFCFLSSLIFYSQYQNNNWLGGTMRWDFNSPPPSSDFTISSFNSSNVPLKQGVSVVSDKNTGQLLFYTNGINVYNKNHALMQNGNDLFGTTNPNYTDFLNHVSVYGGNSSAQGSLIIPNPSNSQQYFVFSLNGDMYFDTWITGFSMNYRLGLKYCIVDMSLNSGLGAVTNIKGISLITNPNTNAMTYYRSSDGGYWLITQNNNGDFLSYKINSNGIVNTTPVISSVPYTMAKFGLKISPNGKYIFDILGRNLYNFNNSNGQITFIKNIIPQNSLYGYYNPDLPCSAEFSEDSNMIYFISFTAYLGVKNLQSSYVYYLCKYNVQTDLLYSYNTNGILEFPISPSSLQLHSNGKIYIKTYKKDRTTPFTGYDYGDNFGWYKINNTNYTGLDFSNVQYFANTNNLYTGYTSPQLVDYYSNSSESPCQEIYDLTGYENNDNYTYYASYEIITHLNYHNENKTITFNAGNDIQLLPNTLITARGKSFFLAMIEGCPENITSKGNNFVDNTSKNRDIQTISNIIVYPNPTSDILNINVGLEKISCWEIYDLSGKIILRGNSNTANVSSLPKGGYMILIKTDKQTASKKFIVK